MKIFLGITEIAGYYKNLHHGLQALGLTADLFIAIPHPMNYGEPAHKNVLVSFMRWSGMRMAISNNLIFKIFWILIHKLAKLVVCLCIASRYDVLIFGFGQTFTNTTFELWFYKILGKRLIFVFHGSDSRLPYIDGFVSKERALCSRRNINKMKKNIARIEKYADCILDSVSRFHLHTKRYVKVQSIGLPYRLDVNFENSCAHELKANEPIRILHSPSNLQGKGTSVIVQCIENLQSKGHDIEFIKIHGMPNRRVLEELERCDFVIDQVYSDTPMSGFSTEAAHFAKPAVIGGYFAGQINNYVNEEDIPPSLYVHPDQLELAIEKLITDAEFRRNLGRRAFEFVRSRWDSKHVAARYLRLIQGDVPEEWLQDPYSISYIHGCGIAEQQLRTTVLDMIAKFGVSSLQLADKPKLEKAFMVFAGIEPPLTQ